nr:Sec-independent protein translocase protein TatB [uncultured Desulfovibrio sp.]
MFGIGSTELLVILVVALIVLGPKSLANVSRTLGKAMGEFRRVSTDFQRTLNAEAEEEEQKKRKKEAAKAARAEADGTQAAQQSTEQAAEQPEPRAAQGMTAAKDAPASEAVLDTTVVQPPSEAPQAESVPQAAPAAEAVPETDTTASGVPVPPEGSPLAEALARTEAEARAAEARITPSTPASENGGKA